MDQVTKFISEISYNVDPITVLEKACPAGNDGGACFKTRQHFNGIFLDHAGFYHLPGDDAIGIHRKDIVIAVAAHQ